MENSWVSGVSGVRERESGVRESGMREWDERERIEVRERERGVRGERKGEVSGVKE